MCSRVVVTFAVAVFRRPKACCRLWKVRFALFEERVARDSPVILGFFYVVLRVRKGVSPLILMFDDNIGSSPLDADVSPGEERGVEASWRRMGNG